MSFKDFLKSNSKDKPEKGEEKEEKSFFKTAKKKGIEPSKKLKKMHGLK